MTKLKIHLLAALAVFLGALLPGCGNGPDYDAYVYPPAHTKEALQTLISACSDQLAGAEIGNLEGQWLPYVAENFRAAIERARLVSGNDKATQAMVDDAVKKLDAARVLFVESVNVGDLDPNDESLVLHLRFSGNCADGSSSGHAVTLHAGNVLCGGGPEPAFTADRFGREGQAIHLEKGGYLSIPYVEGRSETLNPEVMTFMCWVRESAPAPVQRWIFCLDTWNIFYVVLPAGGSEFQLGGQTTRGWIDPIMNSGIHASANWTHLAITYSPEGAAFYKNGELVSSRAGLGNLVKNGARKPFLIGVMDPERELYFEGDLDEFRLYDKVLSAAEVASVFNLEKPASMTVDKTALTTSIDAAKAARDAVAVGFRRGEWLQSAVDAFSRKIAEAEALCETPGTTQNRIDRAAEQLDADKEAFLGAANSRDFDPHLVLGLNFDDGTAADASYLGHTVTAVSGTHSLPPYPAIDRFGRYDGAVHFDRGAHLSIPFDESLNPEQATYMCWIKAADPAGTGSPYLMSINRRFCFYVGLNDREIVFGGVGSEGSLGETASGAVVGNAWQHVALTYSPTGGATLYIDGQPVKHAPGKGTLARVTNSTPFVIGVRGSTDHATSYFRGDLDEILVYDKALTAAEVADIYRQQKP